MSLSCAWLARTHITRLEERLLDIREEQGGGVILFTWLSFLQEDSLAFLGMENVIKVSDLCEVEQAEAASDFNEEGSSDIQASGSSVQNTCDKDEEQNAKPIEKPAEKKDFPTEKEQLQRRYSVRTLVGTVKKWKQLDDRNGHGFIKMSDGREFSFHSKDCLNRNESEGLITFSKGDQVSFEEQRNTMSKKHHNTPKAVNVTNYHQDDIKIMTNLTNELSTKSNEIGSCSSDIKLNEITTNNQKNSITPEQVPTRKEDKTNLEKQIQRKRIYRRQKLVTLFREFDQMKKDEVFSSSLQSCDICFTDKVSCPLIGPWISASHWPLDLSLSLVTLRSGLSVSSLWGVITCTAETV